MDFTKEGMQWSQAYIIFHSVDIDGILSGALLNAHLIIHEGGSPAPLSPHQSTLGLRPIHLLPIDIPQIPETIQCLEERIRSATPRPISPPPGQVPNSHPPRARIIFADLAFNETLNKFENTLKLLSTNHQLELYDPEHEMNSSRLRPFFSTIVTPDQFPGQHISTGSFLAKHLFPDSSHYFLAASYLGRICQAGDYPEESPASIQKDSRHYQDATQSCPSPEALTSYFCSNILHWPIYEMHRHRTGTPRNYFSYFWAPSFDIHVKEYRKKTRRAFNEVRKSLKTFEITTGLKGAIGFSPNILYMKPGIQHVIKTSQMPFSVCVFESGKIIFSKNQQGLNLSGSINYMTSMYQAIHCGDIGNLFGGGGRETGGGGDLNKSITLDEYPLICDTIISRLKEHYFQPLLSRLGL